ncbi:hypothetical protein SAMN03159341_13226 [Paenibacillus sp. 1_12]|uniref:hypothetical protein n=1 Tax=Paenibacillus sp. 1_12 TaxID=1566278 RepID=UPI0008E933DF|nr:hypothetical protein [Paenibacillus sp. 1_12]SFM42212.1 hypothetical protein SAMN03159341_13226 [Paenibacillus sp. 1_12]
MKYKVFGFHERLHKWLASMSVVFITIGCVVYYLLLKKYNTTDQEKINIKPSKGSFFEHFLIEFQDSSFILSVVYALFLFMVGLYLTSMSSKVQNLYYRRKEQYKNLKRLNEVLSVEKMNDLSDRGIRSVIITHQGFTGRISDQKQRPYIQQDGFRYTAKYLKLEESILLEQGSLVEVFNLKLNKYIDCYGLSKKNLNVFITELDTFLYEIDSWVENRLELTEVQLISFKRFINKIVLAYSKRIRNYTKSKVKLMKIMLRSQRKNKVIISRIEEVYGARLHNDIIFEDNLTQNLYVLENLIKAIDNKILTYDDLQELFSEQNSELLEIIESINSRIYEMKEMIEDGF